MFGNGQSMGLRVRTLVRELAGVVRRAQTVEQRGDLDRFHHQVEAMTAGCALGQALESIDVAGDKQDAAMREGLSDGDGGIDAVDVAHEDVHDDEVGGRFQRCFDGLWSAVGGAGVEAILLEDEGQRIGDAGIVVDHEHTKRRRGTGHPWAVQKIGEVLAGAEPASVLFLCTSARGEPGRVMPANPREAVWSAMRRLRSALRESEAQVIDEFAGMNGLEESFEVVASLAGGGEQIVHDGVA